MATLEGAAFMHHTTTYLLKPVSGIARPPARAPGVLLPGVAAQMQLRGGTSIATPHITQCDILHHCTSLIMHE